MRRPATIATAVALVSIGAAIAFSSANSSLRIAPDDARSVDEYRDLGIPDPSHPWTAEEYVKTLRILGSEAGPRLPRASGPSKPLVDRLLISFRGGFELPARDTSSQGSPADELPEDLPALYSPREADGLLFDLELVAIRAAAVERTLDLVQPRSALLDLAQSLAARAQAASSAEAQEEGFAESGRRAEQMAERTSQIVRDLVSDLLRLSAIPQMRDQARKLLLERLEGIVPQLPRYLAPRDGRWMVNMLRGAAASEPNAPIREELRKLAKDMELELETP